MPNEFKIRNGLVVEGGSTIITGSLIVIGGITGSLSGSSGGSAFPFTGSADITGSLGVTGPSTFSGSVGIADNLTLSTGGFIYGNTTSPYIQLNNSLGSKLGFGSDSYVEVGGPTTIVNANTNVIRFRNNRIVATQNTIIGTSDINDTPTARLQVRGSGATSSTTALLVQNSNTSASLTVLDNGNVGVGTTTPANNLDVSGTARFSISGNNSLVINPTTNTPMLTFTGYYATGGAIQISNTNMSLTPNLWLGGNSTVIRIYGTTRTSVLNYTGIDISMDYSASAITPGTGQYRGVYYNPTISMPSSLLFNRAIETTSGDVLFQSGSTTLLLVSGSGNVGIGTNTPSTRLDVVGSSGANYGAITLRSSASVNIDFNFQNAGYSLPMWTIRAQGASSGTTNSFTIQRMGSSFPFTITNAENIGIGTTAPTQKLDVSGSIRVRSGFGYTSDFSGGVLGISILNVDGSDNVVIGSTYAPKNVMLTSGIRYDFASTGLGINVTSPTARLHVRGAGATSSTTSLLVQNSNASASLIILDNGNVGIGAAGAAKTLDVVGQMSVVDSTNSTVVGYQSMDSNTGQYNTAFGYRTLFSNTTGQSNTAIGFTSLYSNSTGVSNISIGNATLRQNTSGSYNIGIGNDAVRYITTGSSYNIGIGHAALAGGSNPIFTNNTAIGSFALTSNIIGNSNTAFGYASLYSSQHGSENTALGANTLYSNISGSYNVAVGNKTLELNTLGSYNIGIGYRALTNNRVGGSNIGLGYFAIQYNISGSENIGIGNYSLWNVTGSTNIGIGQYAGAYTVTGSNSNTGSINSIFLGYNSRTGQDNATNEIVIGHTAWGNGSNSVTLGNDSITKTILKGNVGIRQSSPTYGLDIAGTTTLANNIIRIQPGSNAMSPQFIIDDGSERRLALGTNSGGGIFSSGNLNYAAVLGSPAGYDIQFFTVNTARMTILAANGNVGIGTSSPSYQLHVSGSGVVYASNRFIGAGGVATDPTFATNSTIAGIFEPSYANLGFSSYGGEAGRIEGASRLWNIGMTGGTARFNIRGTGATSATTAFLIQNSTPNTLFQINDDGSGAVNLDSSTATFSIQRRSVPSNRNITFYPNGGFISSTFLGEGSTVGNGDDGVWVLQGSHRRSGNGGAVSGIKIQSTWNQEQFNDVSFNAIHLTPSINSTGTTTNAIARGIYYNPTLTSLTGIIHRAIETTSGDVLFRSGSATLLLVSGSGRVGIGTTTPTFNLDVSGSGRFTDGLTVTGSLNVTQGITGSLFGTASFALSASWAPSSGGGGAAFPFTGSAEITGSLIVTGSISNSVLSGSDSRVLVATSIGTLEATNQVIIQTYIDPNGTQASLLNSTGNWNASGAYVGTTITGTYQGQKHYNTTYFFEAVDDNVWIRLLRV